ncbi:KAP family NTPase [Pseudoalteromonas carrageenovora]|uniref:KAP family P-loop NTPase fold protein n=1 Tax=Pseudoalteromonas carrageenovora TaxID=227 RepID=UPI002117E588|nr:P-loop NTPase fold protein [Pseudoalteromonas carrageenovora]MCQ8891638.1 KAP family NTPase [Pseudoalteromonas carrageenovora]
MCAKQWNEEIKIDGVTYPADQLNRKQDAELLTKILVRRSNSNREKPNKSSYVINVNAEWGAGKTYFVKRWAEDLKHEHPVVYIDAWSNDFMDSPIITVLAEIQEQLLETIDKSHLTQAKRKSFKNIGISVLPKILAALVKRYGGFDIEDLFVDENSDTCTSPSTQNNKSLDLSAAMEAMTTQAFKEHSDYKKGVKELKGTIKELVKYSIEKPKGGLQATARDYPAFIFIDELDRCRPTYAVEMLEAIKHIFDIEGLVIVVSTHTEELQHTIKALYGNDFNADNYLRRFFDTKYHLDVGISASLLEANCDFTVSAFISRR